MATNTIPAATRRAVFEDEHEQYRKSYRTFLQREVLPHYPEWERKKIVPRELFAKCAEHGFLAMEVPEEYGGNGVDDWRFNCVLAEEAVRAGVADAMTGPTITTDIVLPYLMNGASDEQKARWLPHIAAGETVLAVAMTEPGTGSDLAAIQTRARRDGDSFILNGAKTFITNGVNADLVVVAARTNEDKHGGLSLFGVERGTDGFVRGRQIEKLGQHTSDTTELFFDNCRIPAANMIGAEGSGFLQLVNRLVPERLILAVGSIAACETAFDMTLGYVKERRAFGRPIGSFQNSRFAMAEMKTKIDMARCFVDRCITRYLNGACSVEEAAMAKWYVTDLASQVTDTCLQLHGGYGYTAEYPIGKAWIDARVGRIYAGTNEIMKELIGRGLGL